MRFTLLNLRLPLGRLGIFSGKEICKILQKHGFKEVRRRGSHIVLQKSAKDGKITVPVPDHPQVRTGTLSGIIRQSGIPRTEFEA
ncbi:MAG: type II toxin-antitoxin system HicA family toxin [Thermodesulfobacteriota bacterium]